MRGPITVPTAAAEATAVEQKGKWEEAVAAAERMLAVEREVFGDAHVDVAGSLERVGALRRRLGEWGAAAAA